MLYWRHPNQEIAAMFGFKKKLEMPTAAEALPGRSSPIPTAREHFIFHRPLTGPYPDGARDRDVRHGLLLGRRAQVLGARRRHLHHGGRLCGRPHAQPDLRGGLLGAHRPQRGGVRGLRPEEDLLRQAAQDVLGESTIRPRACARATTSARSTAPASTRSRPSSAKPPKPRRRCTRRSSRRAASMRSPPRSSTRRRSISPRTITSSIWRRTRPATAASAAPA